MIVDVAFPIPVTKTFSYSVAERFQPLVSKYLRVKAPFHNRIQTGYIVDIQDHTDLGLKNITEIIDCFPIVDESLIELAGWASHYYLTPIGQVLKYIVPPGLKTEQYMYIQSIVNTSHEMEGLSLSKAAQLYGRETVFQQYYEHSILFHDSLSGNIFSPVERNNFAFSTAKNILFIGGLENRIGTYAEIIAPILSHGSNVLMILPDRNMGHYVRKILAERFRDKVLWYGSEMPLKSRMKTLFQARARGGHLVLGNKSCVFLPIRELELIIIERPEENEYRNEEAFKFNAVTVALKRASIGNIRCIVGSVCPPVEIYHYCKKNDFEMVEQEWMLDKPHQEKFETVENLRRGAFLEDIIGLIQKCIQRRERIAICVPWKFYGSGIICHSCRELLTCPGCGGMYGYKKETETFVCLSCEKHFPYRSQCDNCGGSVITFSRTGVEYIVERFARALPDIELVKITGDSKKNAEAEKYLQDKPVLFVGTQRLSKMYGLHVDKLILIGFEDLRKIARYRSNEKMIQILMNLLDALSPEKVLLTHKKRDKIDLQLFLTSDRFYDRELHARKTAEYPPFNRVFLIKVRSRKKAKGELILSKMSEILRIKGINSSVTGTVFKQLRSYFEWNTIIKSDDNRIHEALNQIYSLSGVQIEADAVEV